MNASPVSVRLRPGKPHILFVEDEPALCRLLAEELSDEYIVDTAGNGLEALKAVMRRKPDLVVSDIVMPLMDGVELLKTLRSEPGTQGVPVLLISGQAKETQRIEGFREGADGYLAKPYSVRELRALIGSMLHAAGQRTEAARREAWKQAEQQALAERAALLESITDAFYALDHQLRFTYINQRALDYFGKTRAQLLGQQIVEVFPIIKGTPLEAQYARAMQEQRSVAAEMISPVLGRWVELHIYPTGQGLAVYFRDISDRKRAEQDLQRAEESLRESDRRKNQFLALLAHELRNPLAPIGNGLQILRARRLGDPLSERTVEMMERQLAHLVRLVDDLLDIARVTRGKLELRRGRVLLTDVLGSAVESARSLIETREHQLQIEVRTPDLVVEGDADRLVQVVANLLTNSAKYTERGGRIVLTLERENMEAVLSVADNGMGIPEQSLQDVFEMFSQLRTRPVHHEGGLGIGLALVQMLVQMHGGRVNASSGGLGMGSTFTVRLPIAGTAVVESAMIESGPRDDVSASRGRGQRVLVVDDNADAASTLQALLQLKGYAVLTAADGKQAIERAQEFRPHIIFMDLGLPGMDGVEAARHIRALPHARQTPIVALTGWGQSGDRERTAAAGMVSHLIKPITARDLQDLLDSLGPKSDGMRQPLPDGR